MKIYSASFYSQGRRFDRDCTDIERQALARLEHILESYHYINKQTAVDTIRKAGKKIFLDSGAFSAFTKGVKINPIKYAHFVEENADIIVHEDGQICASVLDSVSNAQETYENQECIKTWTGIDVLPCFHYGEDTRYLDYYVEKYPYITIGGMVPISTPQLIIWLDRIWSKNICDEHGKPKCKVHGFGLTSLELMKRYPWHSVDSSSWIQYAIYGHIMTQEFGVMTVSDFSPARKIEGQHITTLTPAHRQKVMDLIELYQFDYERLRKFHESRAIFNMMAFIEMEKEVTNHSDGTFKVSNNELF